MDASRKRKATNATPLSSNDDSATKRIKLVNRRDVPSPAPAPATPSARAPSIETVGLQLVNNLRKSQDKSGRLIASQFLSLPPRDELPDYYEFTKLPIAIDTVEDKINAGSYNSISEIESDFKRMVQNAKDYNDTKSEIFEDAERIRKHVYNYMKVHNPAYTEDPNYASFPTPLPKPSERRSNGASSGHEANARASATPVRPTKSKAPNSSEPPDRKSSVSANAANGDANADDGEVNFDGLSFQDAQFAIIDTLLKTTDEEGLEIFTPFANLPSRKLEDYYKFIKYPVSLRKVRKRVDGEHGRHEHTGVTDFKTWDAFEEEVSFIWRNAKDYNEDGSEMFDLAAQFEIHFKSLLEKAKSKVSGPEKPKIKIGAPKPPKVTLNLSANRPSPAPAAPAAVSVDNDALKRQRQAVSAGVSAQATEPRQSPAVDTSKRSTSQAPPAAEETRPKSAVAAASPVEPVKVEKAVSQSPAVNHAVPAVAATPAANVAPAATVSAVSAVNGSMPPPNVRPTSSSPYPTSQPLVSSYTFTAPAALPPTPLRSYPLADALIPKVTIATHPNLNLPKPLKLVMPPHPTLIQQSRTVTLPSSHYFLQISPTISKGLSFGRPYKMFVTVNNIRLTQRDTQQDGFLRTHVYETSLAQGVNRIEIEVVASKDQAKEGLDVERVTVFANLLRS